MEPVVTQAESRDQMVSVRCTRSEKQDVHLVAAFDQTTESDAMRDYTMAQVRERAAAIRAGEAVARQVA